MAQQLPLNAFYKSESNKQSNRDCVNFMPVPSDEGEYSSYSLYSTTGIEFKVSAGTSLASEVKSRDDLYDGVGGVLLVYPQRLGFLTQTVITYFDYELDASSRKTSTIPLEGQPSALDLQYKDTGLIFTKNSTTVATNKTYAIPGSSGDIRTISNIGSWTNSELEAGLEPGSLLSDAVEFNPASQTSFNSNIIDAAFVKGRHLFLNGRVSTSVAGPGSESQNRVYYSDLNDAKTIDELSFFFPTSQQGDLIGIEVINDRIYVFTESEVAVFVPQNDPVIPFVEQSSSARRIGLLGTKAKTVLGDTIFMIGRIDDQPRFIAFGGAGAKKISTKEIDAILQKASFENANVFSFLDQGRSIIAFSFNDYTFCYDAASGEFHRRSSRGGQWEVKDQTRGNIFLGFARGFTSSDSLGFANSGIGTEFDSLVEREVVTANFNSQGVSNRVSEICVIPEIDYTNYTADYENPNLMLSISGDYGNTYSSEKAQGFGPLGVFDRLLRFLGLGIFRQSFTVKLRTLNPYPHRINKVLARLKKGRRQI